MTVVIIITWCHQTQKGDDPRLGLWAVMLLSLRKMSFHMEGYSEKGWQTVHHAAAFAHTSISPRERFELLKTCLCIIRNKVTF